MSSTTRTVTAVAAIAAPLVMLASTLAYIAGDEGLSAGAAGGTLQIWAAAGYGIAIVGLARLLEPAATRPAAALVVLGMIGIAGLAAYGMDAIQASVHGIGAQDSGSAAIPFALRIPGLAFPLTLLLLAVLLTRHHHRPGYAGPTLLAAAILVPISRIGDVEPIAVVSDVLALIALTSIAAALLRPSLTPPATTPAAARAIS